MISRYSVFAILLLASYSQAGVFWDIHEVDKDQKHVLFVDVGVEHSQGVRLEKDFKNGKTGYYMSIIVGDKPTNRMPIPKKIFSEAYLNLRDIVIDVSSRTPASVMHEDCRVNYRIVKSGERDPAWSTTLCSSYLTKKQKSALTGWYKKTLSIIQKSSF